MLSNSRPAGVVISADAGNDPWAAEKKDALRNAGGFD